MTNKTAVLLMAYGTPYKTSDIIGYYTNIRKGKKPTKALYDDLAQRYAAIGGTSPLAKLTEDQANNLQVQLNKDYPNKYKVFIGLKFITPFIPEAIDKIAKEGIKKIIGVPLAPQYSTFSSDNYHERAKKELKKYPEIKYISVKSWWKNQNLINSWSNQLKNLKNVINKPDTKVILSAHSLPLRIIKGGDPYKDEVVNDAKTIAKDANLDESKYTIAWQSAGRTGEEWIGPDFVQVAKDLIKNKGQKNIISGSIGFITDNLEILNDVDIVLREAIKKLGGKLIRLRMPNADPLLIKALEETIIKTDRK